VARLWDAIFDPIMGVLADRTKTRWGRFRPWILWTAVPWAVVMVLGYTTPKGLSMAALIAYAGITNTLLMTLYSMNNMPYSALGGVMTADLDERARLNSFRFIAVNVAQFIVGGFTLPLVAKFAAGSDAVYRNFPWLCEKLPSVAQFFAGGDRAHGWQMTMTIWAVLCLILFMVTFFSTRERIQPVNPTKSSPLQDFADLIKNGPWKVMAMMTLVHFAILSFRGAALYDYFHHYTDKAAMFDFVEKIGLTAPALAAGATKPGGLLEWLGYIIHGTRDTIIADPKNPVSDVFNSIINMVGTLTTITVILLSASFARRFGKKAVAVAGFTLSTVNALAFYFLKPTDVTGMVVLTITGALVYAPTIPLIWAIYADVADYSEWKTGRRFTGMVFATIGFALKAGLALGSASFLWLMAGLFKYDTQQPSAPLAVAGYHTLTGIAVAVMFAICTALLLAYKLNKRTTIEMADELAERRKKATA
jgi:Na+/melibiose symporter-like transporter